MPRILIVDDEKNVLKTLAIGLKRHRFDVMVAQSGPEALKIIQDVPCDVVLSDIRMTQIDGYTLVSRIRERYPWVSIIMMSAYGFDEEHPVHRKQMKYPRLTKPFPVDDLIHLIEEEENERRNQGVRSDSGRCRILLIGEGRDARRIRDVLKLADFDVELMDSGDEKNFDPEGIAFDLFLIDGGVLDSREWKILNRIDQHAPTKPVVLIASNDGQAEQVSAPDLGVTVIDRSMFLKDPVFIIDRMIHPPVPSV